MKVSSLVKKLIVGYSVFNAGSVFSCFCMAEGLGKMFDESTNPQTKAFVGTWAKENGVILTWPEWIRGVAFLPFLTGSFYLSTYYFTEASVKAFDEIVAEIQKKNN